MLLNDPDEKRLEIFFFEVRDGRSVGTLELLIPPLSHGLLLWNCVSASKSPLLMRTPVTGLGPTQFQHDLDVNLIISAKA